MESKVIEFLESLEQDKFERARSLMNNAEQEIKDVEEKFKSVFTTSQKEAIENVNKIINNVKDKHVKSARVAALSTTARYNSHIVGSLLKNQRSTPTSPGRKQTTRNDGNTWIGSQPSVSPYKDQGRMRNPGMPCEPKIDDWKKQTNFDETQSHIPFPPEHSMKRNKGTSEVPGKAQTDDLVNANYRKTHESKRASEALMINNPDIADLSDVNRPTKLAERFSELYDNEWTEVFEILRKYDVEEREIIALLLRIVQTAYDFCGEEAKTQLHYIKSDPRFEDGKENLTEYRKRIAPKEVKSLQKMFFSVLVRLCKGKWSNDPVEDGKTAKFANKAVELTWLMHMQAPPVYLCPATTRNFDPNLYRAYTISGTSPDFFVWPALQLYEKGGLLMKGVVQYK